MQFLFASFNRLRNGKPCYVLLFILLLVNFSFFLTDPV